VSNREFLRFGTILKVTSGTGHAAIVELLLKQGATGLSEALLDRGLQITPKALLNVYGLECKPDYVAWLLLQRGEQVIKDVLQRHVSVMVCGRGATSYCPTTKLEKMPKSLV
jgi:hypothetical protein